MTTEEAQRVAKRLVWERDHIYWHQWQKTGVQWLDEATMILTPRPATRPGASPRLREHRSGRGVSRRGPPSDDPDLADPSPPPAGGRLEVAR